MTTFKKSLKTVIERDTDDIIIFLNNTVGDWSSEYAKLLAYYFPMARKADMNTTNHRTSKLGRYTNMVKETNRKTMLLNVHVRKSEKSEDDDEVKNLDKALKMFSTVLFCKRITIITGKNTDVDKLLKYCEKELDGNSITIIGKKPEKD